MRSKGTANPGKKILRKIIRKIKPNDKVAGNISRRRYDFERFNGISSSLEFITYAPITDIIWTKM